MTLTTRRDRVWPLAVLVILGAWIVVAGAVVAILVLLAQALA